MADSVVEYCGPAEQECRALVQRILASKEFQRTNRLRDFLLYVVDRKLADSPQEITETLIGHRVFRIPAVYNTGEDSIVRTEARILRQRLDRYFSKEGLGEPVILEIPKGSYVPMFRWRELPTVEPPPSLRNGKGRVAGSLSDSASVFLQWGARCLPGISPLAASKRFLRRGPVPLPGR